MLQAIGLKKAYGNLRAVDDVSFDIAQGEAIGLLGPNGAGKTTTVSMIAGLIEPDAGQVLIEGKPVSGEWARPARAFHVILQETPDKEHNLRARLQGAKIAHDILK